MTFIRVPCWKAADAREVLRTEALEGSRAVFMAVHSPVRDFEVEGVLAGHVAERSEQGLLEVLEAPEHRHLFCVIEGEPGSGKSHLVRWLYFRWNRVDDNDEVLMVPRSNGSLEGTLRHLRERLSERYRGFFAGLGQVRDTTLEGRAMDFHSKLANSLDPAYFSGAPPVHAEWAGRHQLNRLFGHPQIIGAWSAPRRILETLSGGEERNSRLESFTLEDIVELVYLLRSIRDRSIGSRAMMAKRKLEKESEHVARLLDEGCRGEALQQAAEEQAGELIKLQEAFNARFNIAVQDLLGVGRDGLVRAFRQLRERLAEDKRRLVLLLEDITSFQGVDNQLLDVLVARSETTEGRPQCDLISVVGVTTDFFNKAMKSYGNLRQRIALHVDLGSVAAGGHLGEARTLASPEGRKRFVANYLRAIRSGIEEIKHWDETTGAVDADALPNRCVTCVHRTPCHAAFSASSDSVGFYPLTPQAIDHIYNSLSDPHGTMSLRTPRGMVQHVLAPLLLQPDRLAYGHFPPPNLECAALPEEEGTLLGELEALVHSHAVDEEERERLRRLLAWWGTTRSRAKTERDEQGHLRLAGVPHGVFAAFDLPWLGSEDSEVLTAPVSQTAAELEAESQRLPPEGLRPEASLDQRSDYSESTSRPVREALSAEPRPQRTPPRKSKVSRNSMDRMRVELSRWAEGGAVKDPTYWSRLLIEILDVLPWRSQRIPFWVQSRLFTENTVMLAGTRRESIRHFVIPREDWVKDGLDAWLVLASKAEEGREKPEFHRRRVARFLRRLTRVVRDYVDFRSIRLTGGVMWNPAATAAQALLARAWLQGRVSMSSQLCEQWQSILELDSGSAESATSHTDGWREIVRRVANYRGEFQGQLRSWGTLAVNPKKDDRGLVDAGAFAGALRAISEDLEPNKVPDKPDVPEQLKLYEPLAEIGRTLRRILPHLPKHEWHRVKQHLETLEETCERCSLAQYLRDVDQVIEQLRQVGMELPVTVLSEWQRAHHALQEQGMDWSDAEGRLAQLDGFLASTDSEEREKLEQGEASRLLAWIIQAPTAEIAYVAEQVEMVQKALWALHRHVERLIKEAGSAGGGEPEDVRSAGNRIRKAAAKIHSSFDV